MFLPIFPQEKQTLQTVSSFAGLNRGLRCGENEFSDMYGVCGDDYPVLSSSKKRIMENPGTVDGCCGGFNLFTTGLGLLFINGKAVAHGLLTGVEHQIIQMGAMLIILPEKVIFDTTIPADPNYEPIGLSDMKPIERRFSNTPTAGDPDSEPIFAQPCREDGSVYGVIHTGKDEPTDPDNGDLWAYNGVYQEYVTAQTGNAWVVIPRPHVRLTCTGIGAGLKDGDAIEISGLHLDHYEDGYARGDAPGDWNSYHIVTLATEDMIVFPGEMPYHVSQRYETTAHIDRKMPDMDFVIESQNRLWGCKYGKDGDKFLNEIYASALGDPTNWRLYNGLSNASYTASRGSDGPWTGAIDYAGSPMFFKQNAVEKVYISSTGAHQITTINTRGVQIGSSKSIAVVDGLLIYRSPSDICAWNGSQPRSISGDLGDLGRVSVVAGALGSKYYCSFGGNEYAYDTKTGMWHLEDAHGKDIRYYGAEESSGRLKRLSADGTNWFTYVAGSGSQHGKWMIQTGILGISGSGSIQSSMKWVRKAMLRISLEKGHKANLFIEYDSSGKWEHKGLIKGIGLRSFTVYVIPKRCDHFRIRLEGDGEMHLYSITKVLAEGSDVR